MSSHGACVISLPGRLLRRGLSAYPESAEAVGAECWRPPGWSKAVWPGSSVGREMQTMPRHGNGLTGSTYSAPFGFSPDDHARPLRRSAQGFHKSTAASESERRAWMQLLAGRASPLGRQAGSRYEGMLLEDRRKCFRHCNMCDYRLIPKSSQWRDQWGMLLKKKTAETNRH
jgi:hypothetical protein